MTFSEDLIKDFTPSEIQNHCQGPMLWIKKYFCPKNGIMAFLTENM
jgi:hypothetical protein